MVEYSVLSAAWAAAGNAARDAAGNAARNAAINAVWNAARNAVLDAAGNAAGKAAWDAAWNAAWNAAGNAAWNAAGNAARNAVLDAAGNAATKLLEAHKDQLTGTPEEIGRKAWKMGQFAVLRSLIENPQIFDEVMGKLPYDFARDLTDKQKTTTMEAVRTRMGAMEGNPFAKYFMPPQGDEK
jgi:hypothetical protein